MSTTTTTTATQLDWDPSVYDPSKKTVYPEGWHPLIHDPRYLRVRALPAQHTSTLILCPPPSIPAEKLHSLIAPLRATGHSNHIAFIFPYLSPKSTASKTSSGELAQEAELLRTLIDEEIARGLDADRLSVGGVEDGLDAALLAVMGGETKIAGVMGVADGKNVEGIKEVLEKEKKSTNALTPVFVVDRSGEEGGWKMLEGLGQAVGAWVGEKGGKVGEGEIVSQKEIELLDAFIVKNLPEGKVEKN